jgi:hypothetical protein
LKLLRRKHWKPVVLFLHRHCVGERANRHLIRPTTLQS